MTRAVGEIDALESGSNALASFGAWHPHIQKCHLDVLGDIQVIYEVEALKHEADTGAPASGELLLRAASDILAKKPIRPGSRAVDQSEDIEER